MYHTNLLAWQRRTAPTHVPVLLCIAALSVIWGALLIAGVRSLDIELFLLSLGLYGLASTIFVLWRTTLGQSAFHAPVYITIVAFIEFGLVPLRAFFDPIQLDPKFHGDYTWLIQANLFILIGMAAFWVGVGFATRPAVEPVRLRRHTRERTATLCSAAILYAIALASKVYLIHANMFSYTFSRSAYYSNLSSAQILDVASQFGLYALVILAIERYSHPNDLTRRVMFYGVFISECFFGAISGMKAPLLVNFLLVGMIATLIRGKLQKKWIIGAIIGLIVVYPFYERYRTLVRTQGVHVSSISQAADTFGEAINDVVHGQSNSAILEQGTESASSRVALLDSVGLLLSLGPNRAKLEGDERAWMIPFFPFVPRFLWRGKPVLDKGLRFSEILGRGKMTSTALTYPGDLLLSYGVPGLLIGMFAFGMFAQWLASKGSNALDKKWLFIYASVFPLETDWELDGFSLWTGVIKALVILTILAWFIYGQADQQSPPTLGNSQS